MSGSGLYQALETCYGPNAVKHMLSGKTVARALRGHFMVESALHTLLLHSLFECSANELNDGLSADDVQGLRSLYDAVCPHECDVCCIDECEGLCRLSYWMFTRTQWHCRHGQRSCGSNI